MSPAHASGALAALVGREIVRFWQQRGRLLSSVVRPALWLLVFAAGFRSVFGVSVIEPYQTYVLYEVYIVPGLLGMVLLFNGMQSSLAMVYDREMGMMRLLLTAPLPRWYLLLCKLTAGTLLSVLQAYAFLAVCFVFQVTLPWRGLCTVLPALLLCGMTLGALGLLLSVYIRQLENFASTMNFVIFPLFFLSSALYPLWKLEESGVPIVHRLAQLNPFTHMVELIRFSYYGRLEYEALLIVVACLVVFFAAAVLGYDPQRGAIARTPRPAR